MEVNMIYSERVRFRAVERTDLTRFAEWLNDPEIRGGLLLYLPLSLPEEENWYLNMLKSPPAEHPMVIEIRQAEEWLMVGNCGIHQIDWRCRSAELGIFIGEKGYWNQGYGTEAMRLLLKHGFETLNLNRLALDVYENNLRAVRSYEKAGFVHEGRKRQAVYMDGRYMDLLIMSVLRGEWLKGSPEDDA
jgi:RimJ/RimL family protein N-acetyltransferase